MRSWLRIQVLLCCLLPLWPSGCGEQPDPGLDDQVTKRGTIEVTAELLEIPGVFPPNKLYDYAYVLKYRVLEVHRGDPGSDLLYVGHYNPLKPRSGVTDKRVKDIGGTLRNYRAGDIHRMALEVPIDDYYMGGIINEYNAEMTGPVYWAVWTNRVVR